MSTAPNQSASQAKIEDPKIVASKAQSATKFLADSIGIKYQQMLKNQQPPAPISVLESNPNLEAQTDQTLKVLADAIGNKYQFVKETQEKQPVVSEHKVIVQPVFQKEEYRGIPRGSHIVSERKGQQRITTSVHENFKGSAKNHGIYKQEISYQQEEGVMHNNIIEKPFEVILENPIVREIYVDRPYDVIVEKPVENIIEKEVIYEKFIENPIERIIENPVEKIIHRNIEVIVEKPVIIEEYIDKTIENVIEHPIEHIVEKEVHVTRNVDRHIERTILKPFRNEVQVNEITKDVPVYEDVIVERKVDRVYQKVIEVPVDVYVDKEYVREVEKKIINDVVYERKVPVPVQRIVNVPEIKKVKKSIVVDKIVERNIDVVKTVDRPFTTVVERYIDVPVIVDRVVEVPRDVYVDKPYTVDVQVENRYRVDVEKKIQVDKYVDVPIEKVVEVPVYVEKRVEVPVEKRVAKYVEVLNERYRDVDVVNTIVIPVDRIVEKKVRQDKHVAKIVERERLVEVPHESRIDREIVVDKVVEVPVYVEKIVEKYYDNIIEKRIEVPVEKYVEVPREVRKEKIIEVETMVDRPIYVDKIVEEQQDVTVVGLNEHYLMEAQDNEYTLRQLDQEYREWTSKLTIVHQRIKTSDTSTNVLESKIGWEENLVLRERLNQLHEQYNRVVEEKNKEYTSSFRTEPRKSGMGSTRVLVGEETKPYWNGNQSSNVYTTGRETAVNSSNVYLASTFGRSVVQGNLQNQVIVNERPSNYANNLQKTTTTTYGNPVSSQIYGQGIVSRPSQISQGVYQTIGGEPVHSHTYSKESRVETYREGSNLGNDQNVHNSPSRYVQERTYANDGNNYINTSSTIQYK